MTKNAPLAITMGDPAGIGPEITLKVASDGSLSVQPLVIGDATLLEHTAKALDLPLRIAEIQKPIEADPHSDTSTVYVLRVREPLPEITAGVVSATCGQAAFDYIKSAIALAKSGDISAIVTAPIHKEALAAADIKYPGHTEMLTDFGGASRSAMMLANDELRVVLVTIHCALRKAIDLITIESELDAIKLAHEGARQFGIKNPRVAVAGLNPHAERGWPVRARGH